MKEPIDADLLKKFAKNQCTAEELARVREFMARPDFQEIMDRMLNEEWDAFSPETVASPEEREEWRQEFEVRKKEGKKPLFKRFGWIGYAAAACILLPLLFRFFLPEAGDFIRQQLTQAPVLKQINMPAGQRATITLADSSVVYLGPGSSLRYPERFAGNSREISLTGEAYFEIHRDPDKPFTVHSQGIQTKVLGTSFKIDAFSGAPMVVSVTTGKVSLSRLNSGAEETLAVLTRGERASFDPVTRRLVQSAFNAVAMTDWKSGWLTFDQDFSEVVACLERWYNVRITLAQPELGTKKVRISINTSKPVNSALGTISRMTGMKYRINGREIQFYHN